MSKESSSKKKSVGKYFIIAAVLGIIGASAGVLIGVTNYFTAPIIAENEKVAKQNMVESFFETNPDGSSAKFFGDEVVIDKSFKKENKEYKNLESYIPVYNDEAKSDLNAYVFICDGRNAYGRIKLAAKIVATTGEDKYKVNQMGIIVNDQSFGQKFIENYVDPFNKDPNKFDDTTCGASMSAGLAHSMCESAIDYLIKVVENQPQANACIDVRFPNLEMEGK